MRVFLTGATGYIGGDILAAVAAAFPTAAITALVRDAAAAAPIADHYANVALLPGDLDAAALLEDQAAQSDVVINAASNKHVGAARSIAKGIARAAPSAAPPVYIQISGASVLALPDIAAHAYGQRCDRVHDDVAGADALIRDLIEATPARALDQAVLALAQQQQHGAAAARIRTALVFPPVIYGEGRGLGNRRSIQVPGLCRTAVTAHEAVFVGAGEAAWGNVHVADLSELVVRLVRRAAADGDDARLWNRNGLYFVQAGEMTWKAIAQAISTAAGEQHSGIAAAPPTSKSPDEIDAVFAHGRVLFGTNARARPARALSLLGWAPARHSLADEIPLSLRREVA